MYNKSKAYTGKGLRDGIYLKINSNFWIPACAGMTKGG
jgi:hypothetical protein